MTNTHIPSEQYPQSSVANPEIEEDREDFFSDIDEEMVQEDSRPYERSAYLYDELYSQKPYAREAAALIDIIDSRLQTGGNDMLEVACGTGKYFEPLGGRFHMEGLDLSPEQLDVARQKFPDTPLYQGDMTNFTLPKEYDVVACLFSSIGCADTLDKLRSAVDSMSRAVKPGGQILIEPWVFEGELRGTPSMITIDQPDVKLSRINTVTQVGNRSIVKMSYQIWRPDTGVEQYNEEMSMGLYSKEEYLAALSDAGIKDIQFLPGITDNEGELFRRGLFVGTKSEELNHEPVA